MTPTPTPTTSAALIIAILVFTSAVSIMSTDIYAPSLPSLPAFFDTTASMVKLTISLNVLMFGVGQIIHGPLSDRFGRKPILLVAIALFTLASLACALAQTIHQLIIARMIQGGMGAAEAAIGYAIFKDLFGEKQLVRALAIFGMAVALAPAFAPVIGGYIHVLLGWHFNFYLIAALALLTTYLIHAYLPESTTPDKTALRPARILSGYRALLCEQQFIAHAGMVGVGMGVIYTFVTGAPFILIDTLGVPTEHFGYYQAAIVVPFFLGSLASTRAVNHMPTTRLLNIGIVITIAGGIGYLALILIDHLTPPPLLTPLTLTASFALMTLGLAPVFAVAPSKAMNTTTTGGGSVAAMLGAVEMIVAGLAAGAVSLLHDGTTQPVTLTIAGLMIVMLVLAKLAHTTHQNQPTC